MGCVVNCWKALDISFKMSSARAQTILLRKNCVREGFEQITKTLKFEMSQSNRPTGGGETSQLLVCSHAQRTH